MALRVSAALLLASALATAASAAVVTPTPTTYVRRTYTVNVPFFTQYWWVGFIIMFLAFLLIVVVLYVAVQCHFKESDQHRRRKEIEATRRGQVSDSEEEMISDDYSNGGRSEGSNPLRTRRH